MTNSKKLGLALAALTAWLALQSPPPTKPVKPTRPQPVQPAPQPQPQPEPQPEPRPQPGPWGDPQAAGRPQIGGRTSPDGTVQLQVDLPANLRRKNVGGRDGAGLCVFTSIEFAGKWQNVPSLFDLQDKMRKEPGGGYPEKVDQMLKKYAPNAQYFQDTSGDSELLKAILASGRMAAVTYDGHDPHYGEHQSIAHMVSLVHYDGTWACVSDNNFIGENDFVWMSCSEFDKRWKGKGGGWVVCLLAPPPPPIPHP